MRSAKGGGRKTTVHEPKSERFGSCSRYKLVDNDIRSSLYNLNTDRGPV